MAVDTAHTKLGFFVDACVETLDAGDLRLTPFTRCSWEGLDKELCERVLWQLDEFDCETVARDLKVKLEFVEKLQKLSGANGGSHTLS